MCIFLIIYTVDKEELRSYMIRLVLDDKLLLQIGEDKIHLWLPLIDYKVSSVVDVAKNLDDKNMSRVLSITVPKLQRLVIGINNAVRNNYDKGEDSIIRALVELLTSGRI